MREARGLKERLAKIIDGKTGQKLDKVKANMGRAYWMSADEALEYGVVDEVIGRKSSKGKSAKSEK